MFLLCAAAAAVAELSCVIESGVCAISLEILSSLFSSCCSVLLVLDQVQIPPRLTKMFLSPTPMLKRVLCRSYATTKSVVSHDILICGGGTAGINVAQQLKKIYEQHGSEVPPISIVDKARLHHYQPGWTLVGAGLAHKSEMNRAMTDVVPDHATHIDSFVSKLNPEENTLVTDDGTIHSYKSLVLCPGISLNYDGVEGLQETMGRNGVSTIYDYEHCDQVWSDIQSLEKGTALFTHPKGDVKCVSLHVYNHRIQLTIEIGRCSTEDYVDG